MSPTNAGVNERLGLSESVTPGQPREVTCHMELLGFIGQVGEKTSARKHWGAILRGSSDLDEPVRGDAWRTLFDRNCTCLS